MAVLDKKQCADCPSKDMGIFCGLTFQEAMEVSSTTHTLKFKRGQSIFSQGNSPEGIYCIQSGNIKLTKTGQDGKETIIRIVTHGDVIGHRSLFTAQEFHGTATALDDVVVCFIDRNHVLKLINDKPSIALELINKLSRDMGVAEERSSSFHQKNVRERIAQLILELSDSHGVDLGNGEVQINLKLTREEMATMIGTANETLIRIISEYRKDGLIDQNGKLIVIKDRKELQKRADGVH
ncbi:MULTISPECIES: Crp/Fnr family transcriptional regulator [Halobacteriovorax]|uniref:Crp/Fnr family transcriptional regulator n=1 Tax=Halobacteriovorax vibrionivorans TaxID=2152716 RepID=A0ABY0IGF7_9BACT|nr:MULTISPECIES: Crp/Fnr family transcriptional regulator [Halobacteriovorax]AYF44818.1 cyclic nucleotide-binding domain protein [Halobacteriovorax sp. BALOs_7]RZF20896.1 Crp/Fnr family transcriptional regulator [Halobacteriovorax vibrionivorans]TGD48094.1 Crp/Fnr family transcriptional regulator [Halobacteriovorax sp. Y22]